MSAGITLQVWMCARAAESSIELRRVMVPQEIEAILDKTKARFIITMIAIDLRPSPLVLGVQLCQRVGVPKTKDTQGVSHLLQNAIARWITYNIACVPSRTANLWQTVAERTMAGTTVTGQPANCYSTRCGAVPPVGSRHTL